MIFKLSNISTSRMLHWAFFLLLIGYGGKFLFGDGPFSLLENQEKTLNQGVGILFITFSFLMWIQHKILLQNIAILSGLFLLADSFSALHHSNYVPEQMIEHATKLLLPLLILFRESTLKLNVRLFLKITVALTFIGHGLFAVGWHYVPDNFHEMTTSILGVNQEQSQALLFVIGWLDFIAAICLFLSKTIERTALVYLIIWGLLTSLARVALPVSQSNFEFDALIHGTIGAVYRLPHFLLPILLFKYVITEKRLSRSAQLAH